MFSKRIARKKNKDKTVDKSKSTGNQNNEKNTLSYGLIAALTEENFDLESFQVLKLGHSTEKGILNFVEDLRNLKKECSGQIQDVVLDHRQVISRVLDTAPEIEKKLQLLRNQTEQLNKMVNERDGIIKGLDQFLLETQNSAKKNNLDEILDSFGNQSEWFQQIVLKLIEIDIAIMKGHSEGTIQKYVEIQQIVNQNVYFQKINNNQSENQQLLSSWSEVDWVRGSMCTLKGRIFNLFQKAFEEKQDREYILRQVIFFSDDTTGALFVLQCGKNLFDVHAYNLLGKGPASSTLDFIGSTEKMYEITSKICELFMEIIKDITKIFEKHQLHASKIHLMSWIPNFLDKFLVFLQEYVLGFDHQVDRCAAGWGLVLIYLQYIQEIHQLILIPHAQNFIDQIVLPMIEAELNQMNLKCVNLITKDMENCLSDNLEQNQDELESLNWFVSEVGRIGRSIIPIQSTKIFAKMKQILGDTYKSMVQTSYLIYEQGEKSHVYHQNMVALMSNFRLALEVGLPYEFKEVVDSPLQQIVDMKRMMASVDGLRGNLGLEKF